VITIKIVTVNVPESYLDAIEKLIGDNGLYPSRSELIRVAVREFLLKAVRRAKHLLGEEIHPNFYSEEDNEKDVVKIPVESESKDGEDMEYRVYDMSPLSSNYNVRERKRSKEKKTFMDVIPNLSFKEAKIIEILNGVKVNQSLSTYEIACSIPFLEKKEVKYYLEKIIAKFPRLVSGNIKSDNERYFLRKPVFEEMIKAKGFDSRKILRKPLPDELPKPKKPKHTIKSFKTYKIIKRLDH
jgi:Arc/MetJ-type ribon-helix-helix transcriptional regulator